MLQLIPSDPRTISKFCWNCSWIWQSLTTFLPTFWQLTGALKQNNKWKIHLKNNWYFVPIEDIWDWGALIQHCSHTCDIWNLVSSTWSSQVAFCPSTIRTSTSRCLVSVIRLELAWLSPDCLATNRKGFRPHHHFVHQLQQGSSLYLPYIKIRFRNCCPDLAYCSCY